MGDFFDCKTRAEIKKESRGWTRRGRAGGVLSVTIP